MQQQHCLHPGSLTIHGEVQTNWNHYTSKNVNSIKMRATATAAAATSRAASDPQAVAADAGASPH